ncbi:MAG: hypothetical protein P8163_21355 [Candidatus Thiodiazotropha sp.]
MKALPNRQHQYRYEQQLNSQNNDSQAQSKTDSAAENITTEERLKSTPTLLERSLGYAETTGQGGDQSAPSRESSTDTTASAVERVAETAGDAVATLEDGFKSLQVDEAFQQLNYTASEAIVVAHTKDPGPYTLSFKE